jgi:hypothetical protein
MRKRFPLVAILLICIASTSFAQTTKPRAYVLAELESVDKTALALVIDCFLAVLKNTDGAQGYVVNYGSSVGIKNRKKLILNANRWRCGYDPCRITFVDGPKRPKVKTIFWVVPNGAEGPAITE